jgi:hypothetical protein
MHRTLRSSKKVAGAHSFIAHRGHLQPDMQETSQQIGTLEPPIPRFIGEGHMPELDEDRAVRKRAYFIWENEGRPHGRALEHWQRASAEERLRDEEKILEGRPDANIPTLLTKDAPGG